MSTPSIQILPFDRKAASPSEYTAVNQLLNRIRLERLPDDPPIPLEQFINNMQSIPDFVDLRMWAAWLPEQSQAVALANVAVMRMEENKHMAQFELNVHPDFRRQGLGRQLLSLIAGFVQEQNRRLLMTDTIDRIPAGEIFMQHIGAQKGMEAHTNQLRLAELNHEQLAGWLSRGQQNQAEFELGFWDGAYPEDKIQQITELYDLTNQQPFGDLEIEDMHMTPEQLRQSENNFFARGLQRWTFYIVDRVTGKFAGYTETLWNPSNPEVLSQMMTGVFPQYRNKGLGRWLKAVMLDKALKERPQVKYVRTGNADSNTAMLKINNELGFKPYFADTIWQVELKNVLDYLGSSNV